MMFTYKPEGVCSQLYEFDIEGHTIKNVKIHGGCNGNLQGIAKLIEGQNVEDVIPRIEGIKCGYKPTSCPDQISKALKAYLNSL